MCSAAGATCTASSASSSTSCRRSSSSARSGTGARPTPFIKIWTSFDQHRPETVLILAGDHVYKMDYGPLLAFHKESGADITIGGVQVPIAQAHEFGVMSIGADHRVVSFDEKPKEPRPMPGREGVALASMGIYVINPEFLREALERDAADPGLAARLRPQHRSRGRRESARVRVSVRGRRDEGAALLARRRNGRCATTTRTWSSFT